MSELSSTTRALLRAARQDGPGAAGRSQIWSGVAAKAAGGAALGAAGSKAAASAATAKLFVMGALLGSAVTVGIAAMVLHVGPPSLRPDPAQAVQAMQAMQAMQGVQAVRADTESASASQTLAPAVRAMSAAQDQTPSPVLRVEPGKHSAHVRSMDDSLGREAQLVAEARGAVVRGEPEAALSALRAAHALPAHALEPEELSLEVRALRAVGRMDEANAADARLRAKFPDHALAR